MEAGKEKVWRVELVDNNICYKSQTEGNVILVEDLEPCF